jgi:hypothetical protein
MKDQNDVKELAKAIEERAKDKAEARKHEATLSDGDKKCIEETIDLFNALEREGVLSYRAEAPPEDAARALRFAIKGGQPIIITISANKVRFEKLQPSGSRETVNLGIAKPGELTRDNMKKLIGELLKK